MADERSMAQSGELPEGVTRLPQPIKTNEIREWKPAAIGFNILTNGRGINAVEKRRDSLKDVRNGTIKHTTMSVRMEIAATVLAAGGSTGQAGRAIGASRATIRKYLENERFRQRVGELQSVAAAGITGRILSEFDRRTRPEALEKLEVLDLTRIFDRVVDRTPHAVDAKATEEGVDEDAQHQFILQQILTVNTSGQSADFPSYSPEELRLSDGDSQG